MTSPASGELDPIQLGREFTQRLAENLCAVSLGMSWPYLDRVLLDWWYETVIEPHRASDDGMPEYVS